MPTEAKAKPAAAPKKAPAARKSAVKAPKKVVAVAPTGPVTFEGNFTFSLGKRKTAVARLRMYKGSGQFQINKRPARGYLVTDSQYESFMAPFVATGLDPKSYDLDVTVAGSGLFAQADACRHALAKALDKEDATRHTALKQAGFLTRDARIKERKKPGLKRARRAPQWAKR